MEFVRLFEGQECHVVRDADREAVLRLRRFQVLIDGGDLRRRRVLGGESVAASDHLKIRPAAKRRADVLIEGLSRASALLGPVKDGDGFHALRKSSREMLKREWPEEMNLDKARFFSP